MAGLFDGDQVFQHQKVGLVVLLVGDADERPESSAFVYYLLNGLAGVSAEHPALLLQRLEQCTLFLGTQVELPHQLLGLLLTGFQESLVVIDSPLLLPDGQSAQHQEETALLLGIQLVDPALVFVHRDEFS